MTVPDLPAPDRVHVVALPLRTRFRGITVREALLVDGQAGWGELSPFVDALTALAVYLSPCPNVLAGSC